MNFVKIVRSGGVIRKAGWIACILLVALCSCNSSKHASKKRRKMAPCDCPKFSEVQKADKIYDVAFGGIMFPRSAVFVMPPSSIIEFENPSYSVIQ